MKFILTSLVVLSILVSAGRVIGGAGHGIFTSQTRFVTGSAFADDGLQPISDADSDEALDFGPFDAGASASAEIPDVAIGTGGGTQNSTLLFSSLSAAGSAFATAESFADEGTADGSGFSRCVVQFVIPSASDFTLQGNIAAFDSGLTFVSLRDRTTEVYGATVVGPATRLPIDESGTLQPGSYTLEIESSGNAFADPFSSEFAFAEFDLDFSVEVDAAVPALGHWGVLFMTGLLLGAGTLVLARRRGGILRGPTTNP